MDWMEQEKERGITIHFRSHNMLLKADIRINIIDTPGHVGFTREAERSMQKFLMEPSAVLDRFSEYLLLSSETVWRQADKYEVPRGLPSSTRWTKAGADFFYVSQVHSRPFLSKAQSRLN